jgi:hypothetical protein
MIVQLINNINLKSLKRGYQGRTLCNEKLAKLIEEWVNTEKPSEYYFADKYNIHPRTVFRLISQHYKGHVNNGVAITLQSKINNMPAFRPGRKVEISNRKAGNIIALFRSNPKASIAVIAAKTRVHPDVAGRIITNYLTNKYCEVA